MSSQGIFQRDDGRWSAVLTVDGKRKTVYGKSEHEVRREVKALEGQIARHGRLADPGRRTVNDLLDLWLETADLRPGTLADYRDVLARHVRPALGSLKLARLDPGHLQALCNSLRTKGLKRIPHLVYGLLHRALGLAVLWGWLPTNPADRVLKPRYQAARKEVWSNEEIQGFLSGAADHRLYPLWVLTLASRCRIGELLALCWEDVDLAAATVAIGRSLRQVEGQWIVSLPKTRAGLRTVSLPTEGVAALKRQRAQQNEWRLKAGPHWQERSLVFSTEAGQPLGRSSVEQALYRVCARLGLPRTSPHGLRHLHASLLLARGLPVPAVAARLGHANAAITLSVYAHYLPGQDREAAALLQEALAGKGSSGVR